MSTLTSTMTRSPLRRRAMAAVALAGALIAGSAATGLVPQAGAAGAAGAPAAEASLSPAKVTIGDKIRVQGTGWTHSSGTSGSRIAIKIETVDPAAPMARGTFYNRLKAVPEINNVEVWKVVDADNSGNFDVTFPLPNGTKKGKNGSDPAMTKKGTYGIRLLTGSLITGDTARSMKLLFEAKAQPKIKVTKAPKVAGTAKVGKTVSATNPAVSVEKPSFAYRWYVGSTAVSGSAGAKKSFKLASAHAGKKVSVKVTASKTGYRSVSATSKKVTVKR